MYGTRIQAVLAYHHGVFEIMHNGFGSRTHRYQQSKESPIVETPAPEAAHRLGKGVETSRLLLV